MDMHLITEEKFQLPLLEELGVNHSSMVQNCRMVETIRSFRSISLQEMDDVALLNRVDQKFIMTQPQLAKVLEPLQKDYRVLTIMNNRASRYRTIYFDTPDFALFRMHVNDRAERYKVRYREYVDTSESFLEVKHKTRKDRTEKQRIPVLLPYAETIPEVDTWLNRVYPFDSEGLEPKLTNSFTRITLVGKTFRERVTIDTNLVVYTHHQFLSLDGLVVAEVKSTLGHQYSPFIAQMRALRIHPQSFSKYCVGVSLLFDNVKKNAIKPKLLMMKRMIEGAIDYE